MMRIVAFAVCVSLCECQYRQFHQREAKIQHFLRYDIIVRANVTKCNSFSYDLNVIRVYKPKKPSLKISVYTPPFDKYGIKVNLTVGKEYLLGGYMKSYNIWGHDVVEKSEITCNHCYYEPWSPWIDQFLPHYIR